MECCKTSPEKLGNVFHKRRKKWGIPYVFQKIPNYQGNQINSCIYTCLIQILWLGNATNARKIHNPIEKTFNKGFVNIEKNLVVAFSLLMFI